MKKFSKIGKRVLAFFLVALMNINAYATTTSNDGSEFVTKAEFDDMMKRFNEQMETYNAGLNAKIDNAIASYLAGMSTYATKTLDNYYKTITANQKFYWTSSESYTYQANKCVPKHGLKYEETSRMYEFMGSWTTNGSDDTMPYGSIGKNSSNADYFIINNISKISPVIEQETKYFYAFYTAATATAQKASNGIARAMNKITIEEKTGTDFEFISPGDTGEGSNVSWRTIQNVLAYSDSPKDQNSAFVLCPYSATETYAYATNNKNKCTGGTKTVAYNSTSPKWTWTDTRVNTSVQTRAVGSITKNNQTFKCLDPSATTIPWMHTKYKMNEIGYSIINSATNESVPIKYGVKISSSGTDSGEVSVTYKATVPGYAIFHRGAASSSWPKPSDTNIPADFTVSDLLSANETITTVIKNVAAGDGIWFVYYPQDVSVTNADVTISKIILTVK